MIKNNVHREVKTRTSISLPVSLYEWECANVPNLSQWVAHKLDLEREMITGNEKAYLVACPTCHAEVSTALLDRNGGRCPSCGGAFK